MFKETQQPTSEFSVDDIGSWMHHVQTTLSKQENKQKAAFAVLAQILAFPSTPSEILWKRTSKQENKNHDHAGSIHWKMELN